ncbi:MULTISPECIES: type IV secretion system effector chaperone VirE1 [Rhizobium/Agrobacterium group]|uniref:Protein secretion chaperone n=2 Tax=Rhizobium/Agrobacterium group TaxID=227290 RepID=B9K426_ALLAM|nr:MULTISPECIES: type IV secretion system effector chaperone VirE1 [Rhizobium/Agrobacterium group]ACM39680.1 protein secretion chaperone [Allorhizobium ampelinum S4]ASK49715.1 hypothetical protein [Agrobacterium vitis]MCF1437047.1 type IV secretion system effector chaperone VirE1 [Allorhizobium ampelinum]MCF1450718.1 type IV secretion system effector chaperone VirE1 [Allorhizobium ampelinum]MCF1496385.1 type IV secretion system effector chaperone VirE1 [Allorhizobium ampelinum]
MAISELNVNKNMPVLSGEEPQKFHMEELSDNYQPNGFTSLDLDMIELENFVLQCPLPEDNLAG